MYGYLIILMLQFQKEWCTCREVHRWKRDEELWGDSCDEGVKLSLDGNKEFTFSPTFS